MIRVLGWLLLPVKWLIVGVFRAIGWVYMVVLFAVSLPWISLNILILILLLSFIFIGPPPLYH